MRSALIIFMLFWVAAPASADRLVNQPGGGTCWMNERSGQLWGCTPRPSTPSRPSDDEAEGSQRSLRDAQSRTRKLEAENRALRAEQERQRYTSEQAQRKERERIAEENRPYLEAMRREQSRREHAYVEQKKREERDWNNSWTEEGCNSPEYAGLLKSQGLKKHQSVKGICVPTSRDGVAVSCPPCL